MSVLSEISARELLVPLVAAPLIGALLCIFLKKRVSDVVAAIFAAITLVLALGAIGGVFGNLGSTITVPLGRLAMLGGETGQAPLVFELSIDALSALMLFMVTVIGFLVVVYSSEYLSPNNVEHPAGENKSLGQLPADVYLLGAYHHLLLGAHLSLPGRSITARRLQGSDNDCHRWSVLYAGTGGFVSEPGQQSLRL